MANKMIKLVPLDEFALSAISPDIPAENLYIEAAHKLIEIAEDYPVDRLKLWWFRVWNFLLRGRIVGSMRKYVTTVSQNRVRLILTKRLAVKPTWHLSVLPQLNKDLFDWEERAIRNAFGIPSNSIFERDGAEFVWYWE